MATLILNYNGSSTSMTLTLPGDGAARESTAVDNTSNKYVDALVRCKFTAGTVTGNKQAIIWLYGSEDGTNYDSNATGSDAAITMRAPDTYPQAKTIPTPTSSIDYDVSFAVAQFWGGVMPRKWGIVFQADGIGTATNGAFSYTGITYDM